MHVNCEWGLVSGAVELRNELSRAFALDLSYTIIYDYPTPKAIADYIFKRLAKRQNTMIAAQPTLLPLQR